MNVNGGPDTRAYPSIAEGRPAWCRAGVDLPTWLSEFSEDRDAWIIDSDLFIIKGMGLPARRVAWSRARGSFRAAGLWTDGGCNDQGDVDQWSPLFRRFVVWLK